MTVVGRTGIFPNRIDQTTSGKADVEYQHKQVHSGDAWETTYLQVVDEAATFDRYIITPNTTRWAHMFWTVEGQGLNTVSLYEGASGTYNAATVYNRNRNSARVNTTIIGIPSGAVTTGSLIWTWTSGTAGPAVSRSVGVSRESGEIVLKQNTTYLFRCTSGVNGNAMAIMLYWYEQTNIEN